jgi:hypothetical protein
LGVFGDDDALGKKQRAGCRHIIGSILDEQLQASPEGGSTGCGIEIGQFVDADFHGEVAGDGGLSGEGELVAEALGGAGEVAGAGHIAEAADGCGREDADDGYDDQQFDEGKGGGFFQEDTEASGAVRFGGCAAGVRSGRGGGGHGLN